MSKKAHSRSLSPVHITIYSTTMTQFKLSTHFLADARDYCVQLYSCTSSVPQTYCTSRKVSIKARLSVFGLRSRLDCCSYEVRVSCVALLCTASATHVRDARGPGVRAARRSTWTTRPPGAALLPPAPRRPGGADGARRSTVDGGRCIIARNPTVQGFGTVISAYTFVQIIIGASSDCDGSKRVSAVNCAAPTWRRRLMLS